MLVFKNPAYSSIYILFLKQLYTTNLIFRLSSFLKLSLTHIRAPMAPVMRALTAEGDEGSLEHL